MYETFVKVGSSLEGKAHMLSYRTSPNFTIKNLK